MTIDSIKKLRELYETPKERAVLKTLTSFDVHCVRFVELSPFIVIATAGPDGQMDASPRGGAPGFVEVLDSTRFLIPDAPGNNRLDSITNIIETGHIGLLFMIPGVDETLRVNGSATMSADPRLLDHFDSEKRAPRAVIDVRVGEAFLHCAKAFMRSNLWSPEGRIDRSELPTLGEMLNDQTGSSSPPETQAEMIERYKKEL